ncbi:3-isopropylmalate dehydrogenase [Paraburkholderia strydomiana]|nr:3-isopropylmalate dehydrogenase [Paraburkholderia strydomiana]
MKIAVLPGDGIGPEIVKEAVKVLNVLGEKFELEEAPVGGAGYEAKGHPLPDSTLALAKEADAILFGGRRRLEVRQARTRAAPGAGDSRSAQASAIVRELPAGNLLSAIDRCVVAERRNRFGSGYSDRARAERRHLLRRARGVREAPDGLFAGSKEGFDTMRYSEPEVRRIAHVAFQAAQKRGKKLTSVDKANVLETSQFWKDVMIDVSKEYADVELSHMYVDNAAMQLVKAPKSFDVIVTGNMFGDILSDEAAMLTGSIGMLPSASLDKNNKGLYEPSHGSAPDIAGKGVANPLATILSAAMMLRYSLNKAEQADRIENAVKKVLEQGYRTGDILTPGCKQVGTVAMGDAVVAAL